MSAVSGQCLFPIQNIEDFENLEFRLRFLYETAKGHQCQNLLTSEYINWKRQVSSFVLQEKLRQKQRDVHLQCASARSAFVHYQSICNLQETQCADKVITCFLPGLHIHFHTCNKIAEIGMNKLIVPRTEEKTVRKRSRFADEYVSDAAED